MQLALWLYKAWTHENFTYVTFLKSQIINYLVLYMSWLLPKTLFCLVFGSILPGSIAFRTINSLAV